MGGWVVGGTESRTQNTHTGQEEEGRPLCGKEDRTMGHQTTQECPHNKVVFFPSFFAPDGCTGNAYMHSTTTMSSAVEKKGIGKNASVLFLFSFVSSSFSNGLQSLYYHFLPVGTTWQPGAFGAVLLLVVGPISRKRPQAPLLSLLYNAINTSLHFLLLLAETALA